MKRVGLLTLVVAFFGITSIIACTDALTQAQTSTQANPPIVYVAGDGSGDYNCDGSSDQVEINLALDFVAAHADYTTVYLKGPHTYWIDSSIFISANTTLTGDSSAVVKLVDNAGWGQFRPLIGQTGTVFAAELNNPGVSTNNITIQGFEMDGNKDNQTGVPDGNSYYTLIQLQNCYNVTINDMYLHHNTNDAIRFVNDTLGADVNSQFYNNRIHDHGHSGIYLINVDDFQVHDNNITGNRTDAGVRPQYCNHFKIYDNTIGNDPDRPFSGGAAIQIEADSDSPVNDVEIYGNYLYGNQYWHGIWLNQESGSGTLNTHRDVHIHHNVISWYQQAGIGIYGFHNTLIENNVIEMSDLTGGIVFYAGDPAGSLSGFQTIVRNNIITDNATYGIDNQQPAIHSFVSDYNCIYGNASGHYHNGSSTTDRYVEPEFANDFNSNYAILSQAWQDAESSGDWHGDLGTEETWKSYHLKSERGRWDGTQWVADTITSLCIDAGNPTAGYANEPVPNGGRINVGAFGNTTEASQSIARPRAIDDLGIAKESGRAKLSWPAITTDLDGVAIHHVEYSVYRAIGEPYFTPSTPYATAVTALFYQDSDTGVLSDPAHNAFYLVTATNAGLASDASNRVGSFNFALVTGAP